MNPAEREQLLDLHRAAVEAWAAAECGAGQWGAAYAADDRFRATVLALE